MAGNDPCRQIELCAKVIRHCYDPRHGDITPNDGIKNWCHKPIIVGHDGVKSEQRSPWRQLVINIGGFD